MRIASRSWSRSFLGLDDNRPDMRVYFAGPLFCEAERVFNLRLAEKLEAKGYQVFLPQRDGVESEKPPYNKTPRVPDEGACVELGIAYGQKHLLQQDKLLIGLHTDMRGAFPGGKLNAIINGALDSTMGDEEQLIAEIEAFRSARKARV
jgi:hypothetical protein